MAPRYKIGIHTMMWQERLKTPIIPLLDKIKTTGFDGVEFTLRSLDSLSEAEAIRRKTDELGLGVTCTFGFPPEADIASEDNRKAEAASGNLKRAIEMAAVLGSPLIAGILYSGSGVRAENLVESGKRRERAAGRLHNLADHAGRNGVTLCIEPVNRFETDMISTVKLGIEFIQMTGSQNVRLLFDVFHASIEEKSVPGALRAAGEYIGHIHFSENNRSIPGTGSLPYGEIMQAIREVQYQGWITVEVIGVPDGEFAQRLKTGLLDANPDEAARMSAQFIRRLIA